MWLNYAIPLIIRTRLLFAVWGYHHGQPKVAKRAVRLSTIALLILGSYLLLRLRTAGQYCKPVAEEELVLTLLQSAIE